MVSFEESADLLLPAGISFNRLESTLKKTVLLAVILSYHLSIGSALYTSLIKSSDTCVICNGRWQISVHPGSWFWWCLGSSLCSVIQTQGVPWRRVTHRLAGYARRSPYPTAGLAKIPADSGDKGILITSVSQHLLMNSLLPGKFPAWEIGQVVNMTLNRGRDWRLRIEQKYS